MSLQSASRRQLPFDVHLFETLQCLAPLMAKVDRFLEMQASCCFHQKHQLAKSLLAEVDQFETQLDAWYCNLSTSSRELICWNEPSILWTSQPRESPAADGFATMLCFSSIRIATSVLFAWTGLLFLHRTKDLLNKVLASESSAVNCADGSALRIARTFEYFLHPDIGLFGTYMIGFPLAVSRAYFEQRDMHDELLWLAVIESRTRAVGSGLCDFLREVKSDNILPKLWKGR